MSAEASRPADDGEAAELASIVSIVQATANELSVDVIEQIVLRVAPIRRTRRRLQIALETRPLLLTGGHPNVPATAQDLCHALVDAGASAVVLPACEGCGRHVRMPHKAPDGGRHCSRCERNHRARECSNCGQVRPVYRSIEGDTLCRVCWRSDTRSFAVCSRCGQNATIITRRPEPVCVRCYRAPLKRCSLCDKDGPVATHLDGRRVCARCYYGMRRPRPCPDCGQPRFLTHPHSGRMTCAECAGAPATLACPGCGSVSNSRKHHFCDRCRHPATVRRLLTKEDGEVPEALRPLEAYLLTHPTKSDSIERWALRSGTARTLRDLVEGRLALDAGAIIDALPSPQSEAFLLSLLAAAGLLPEDDVHQARFERWLEHWLAGIESQQDRLILHRYHAWGTNQLLRRPVSRPTGRGHRMSRHRSRLRYCAHLLVHIREAGHTIASFPQRDLDRHLTGSSSQKDALSHFTRWLRQHRLSALTVSARSTGEPSPGMDSDQRWQTARRFLNDDTIPPGDRVGGLLTLLYGMQATRVVALERSSVTELGGRVSLTIGSDPIELPATLGRAVRDLMSASAPKTDRWLFPGRNPGTHLTAGTLVQRLARYGLRLADARATTLLELAQHMHPRLISDLLGLSTTAAARWWRLAAGDWTGYPPIR
ncbi:hypothetical protein SA2016_0806 [Sinomonas atrocyanea]|uniref:Site-specific recombinase XerD n=1 Tax=Sinomonas atrocyanea TaxID=37927 RepID=A0A126ZY51_9MICC|nr:hypothetical protein [Sinomonas atrocyanea]AMM31494.1 hypothetical protein SA2016_0806 [Sinomonas atrocyanea]GEB65059.1 hypothetical protein SAT01_25070 [Sinomonas atrocyanea]GGG63172.1 hypothetical protein GCM10007172_12960 [Sinomonas atrocyanea]